MTCRFGTPQKASSAGHGVSRSSRQTLNKGTRSSIYQSFTGCETAALLKTFSAGHGSSTRSIVPSRDATTVPCSVSISAPVAHRSRCQPNRSMSYPHARRWAGPFVWPVRGRGGRTRRLTRGPDFQIPTYHTHPSAHRSAQRARGELLGPDRVVTPIRIDSSSRRCREQWSAGACSRTAPAKTSGRFRMSAPVPFHFVSSPRGYSHGLATLAC